VVFLDEPTLGLDPGGQREVLRLVAAIARGRGATVLLCTHVLAEVEEVCTRVLILNRGRLVAEGTVDEITRRAAAPRRARFRVPAEQRDRALNALAVIGVTEAEPDRGAGDWLTVALGHDSVGGAGVHAQVARAVQELERAGVPPLAFELEGARLSDAFLAMTEEKE
jgi:ABC-2 type transport system ATP-binding protein